MTSLCGNSMNKTADSTGNGTTALVTCYSVMMNTNNIVDSTNTLQSFCDEQHEQHCRQYRWQHCCSCQLLSFCEDNMNNTADSTDNSTIALVTCHSVMNNMNNNVDSTDTLTSFCDEQYKQYCTDTQLLSFCEDNMNNIADCTDNSTTALVTCHSVMNNTVDCTDTLLSLWWKTWTIL